MAVPSLGTFYAGLALIVVGTGLLKPNMSTMVGALYSEKDARRDAGFSIFYMGINIGAMLSPLVCGYLGENINWHYGFGAAGVGMTLGLIQYVLGAKYLGSAGLAATGTEADRRVFRRVVIGFVVAAALIALASFAGLFTFTAEAAGNAFGVILLAIVVVFFVWLLNAKAFSPTERKRFWAILVLFITSAAFWSAYEQAGSTLNLFAERNTNLHAWDAPIWGLFRASYFQSFNSFFIIAMAPVFAWLWVALGKRDPSIPGKFVWGLVGVGLGFAILIPVANGTNVSPWWLTITYLLHTAGELCLSPVGLSAMTKLAPARVAGLMMGVWFLSTSVGDYIGGMLASLYETFPLPELFAVVAGFSILVGLLLIFLLKPMKKLMGGVH
jgi:POT family proton-dependent oligopeptide transporter